MFRVITTLLACLAMAWMVEGLTIEISERLEQVEKKTQVVNLEPVGQTRLGIPIYKTSHGKCVDKYGDQVKCPENNSR